MWCNKAKNVVFFLNLKWKKGTHMHDDVSIKSFALYTPGMTWVRVRTYLRNILTLLKFRECMKWTTAWNIIIIVVHKKKETGMLYMWNHCTMTHIILLIFFLFRPDNFCQHFSFHYFLFCHIYWSKTYT